MQEATTESVLGDFETAVFVHAGDTTTFVRQGERFVVRTRGADGRMADHPVAYTFGAEPLQQYLIPMGGGRYQVLGVAWDSRPSERGGQRWFHLYPETGANPSEPFHWTGPAQTWNTGCAACHSTGLEVGFDASSLTFDTRWAALDVSCEACHGPGSAHVAAARGGSGDPAEAWGLTVDLGMSRATWTLPAGDATAHRTSPAAPSGAEFQVCASCHARRAPVSASHLPGEPFLDAYEPSLLAEGLYHPDGQIDDEVYVYGSFLQSRMARAGVTCSDCHDPHSLALRADGNALCTRCHGPARYDTPAHHLHEPDVEGARCVACHMPATTYMDVDPRRDHGLRVPRPDVAEALGTPDACTRCHTDRSAGWAAAALEETYGPRDPSTHVAAAIHGGRRGDPSAFQPLTVVAGDTTLPGITRATALTLLGGYRRASVPAAIDRGLMDPDPLVRIGALQGLEGRPPEVLAPRAAPLLGDPLRAIRVRAAGLLAPVPPGRLTDDQRATLTEAWRELDAAHRANAGRPAAWVAEADLRAARGSVAEAAEALRTALALDSADLRAWLNLADLQRATGRDDLSEATLEQALVHNPDAPEIHHAAGLLRVRQGDVRAALESLSRAATEAPGNPRFGYVYAVARASVGDTAQAVGILEEVLVRHPWDADVLAALVSWESARGNREAALGYAERLRAVTPDDAGVRTLLTRLR